MAQQRGYRTIALELRGGESVSVYTSPRLADAMEKMVGDMPVYEGVKMIQLLEAAYLQGRKDGARAAFTEIDRGNIAAKKLIPHVGPGRPRKSR